MTEKWLTGPVPGFDPMLMPVVHALLQVRDDVRRALDGLSDDQVWQRVGASATIGFHALHIAGATDRLLTYARGEQLSAVQVAAAREESRISGLDAAALNARVEHALEAALEQVRHTPVSTLTAARDVGRDHLPSTVIGLLFHAAEHAARHAGQMATLRRIAGQL
jgi:uncharacterized damage-inducible protein DinB